MFPSTPEALRMEAPDFEALGELCREFEFWSLLKELESESGGPEIEPAVILEGVEAFEEATEGLGRRIALGVVFQRGGAPVGLSFAPVGAAANGGGEGTAAGTGGRRSAVQEAVRDRRGRGVEAVARGRSAAPGSRTSGARACGQLLRPGCGNGLPTPAVN